MSMPRSLPSDLTILSLGALRPKWLAALPDAPEAQEPETSALPAWPVDASSVDEVDAAGVQFLLALSHSLKARRHALRLLNPSRPLVGACLALGLSSLLPSAPDSAGMPS